MHSRVAPAVCFAKLIRDTKKKYSQVNKSHFHKKSFVTRKWPIPISARFVSKDAKQLNENGWFTFLVLI